jgi:D-proline reductase (dithiol) PrdB
VCHQSVGLIARAAEAAGISTLCMTSAWDITRAVNPPRAAFLDFPFGHTTGKPHDPDLGQAILTEAFDALRTMTEPGSIRVLPFRWSEDDDWKRSAFAAGDERLPRHDAPQYQSEEDRRLAEEGDPERCSVCSTAP